MTIGFQVIPLPEAPLYQLVVGTWRTADGSYAWVVLEHTDACDVEISFQIGSGPDRETAMANAGQVLAAALGATARDKQAAAEEAPDGYNGGQDEQET